MFSKRLEDLIKAALQDGILTEQEKSAIIKRAQAEGEDIEEVDIYVQSLLQKRREELKQEERNELAHKEQAINKNEKELAKELRKCPKCGTYIPPFTNVCPDCEFIIGKNETDKKMATLISLLRTCVDHLDYNGGTEFKLDVYNIDIKKEQYDESPNCYTIAGNSELGPDYICVDYNYHGIISEALLYRDNENVNTLLQKIRSIEKSYFLEKIKRNLRFIKKHILDSKGKHYADEGIYNRLKDYIEEDFERLKDYQDVITGDEVSGNENEWTNLKLQHDELMNSSEYLKASKKAYKRTKDSYEKTSIDMSRFFEKISQTITSIDKSRLFEKILWAIILFILVGSFWIIPIAFFEKGRDFLKWAYGKVVN